MYQRPGAAWRGEVVEMPQERAMRRWHAAIIQGGVAVWTWQTVDPLAAAEWVERHP